MRQACVLHRERVKLKLGLTQFQFFDLPVLKEWPAADVGKSLGVSLANVYVTKHRIAAAVNKGMMRLERELKQGAKLGGGSLGRL